MILTRRYSFCASHRLHACTLSAEENQQLYGKCNNPYGHGHDYVLHISVSGELESYTGLIVRVADLDYLVATEILCAFAHRNLNTDVEEFKELAPTTENLATVVATRLNSRWSQYFAGATVRLAAVKIQETDRNSVELLVPEARLKQPEEVNLATESVVVNA